MQARGKTREGSGSLPRDNSNCSTLPFRPPEMSGSVDSTSSSQSQSPDRAARKAGFLLLLTVIFTVALIYTRVAADADQPTLLESLAAISRRPAMYILSGVARLLSGIALLWCRLAPVANLDHSRGLGDIGRPPPVRVIGRAHRGIGRDRSPDRHASRARDRISWRGLTCSRHVRAGVDVGPALAHWRGRIRRSGARSGRGFQVSVESGRRAA